jgi:hypothetical protein
VTSPFGEEGAAGARQTCAAMLTSAPAVTALRAFLHTELNAPTAHTRRARNPTSVYISVVGL